jgi:biopolymer transport protein ExbB
MLQYIFDGGVMMLVLAGLSVLALAVIIDRLRAFRLAEVDAEKLCADIERNLSDGNSDGAIAVCAETRGPAAAVALVGLQQYAELIDRGKTTNLADIVSRVMSDYGPHVLDSLEKRLNHLSMVGSVAPLVGMTGTVVGMIISFDSMAAAGGLDGGAVAGGISMALVTTAAGLIVAIPAVIYHNLFTRRIAQLTLDIEAAANTVINFVTLKHD